MGFELGRRASSQMGIDHRPADLEAPGDLGHGDALVMQAANLFIQGHVRSMVLVTLVILSHLPVLRTMASAPVPLRDWRRVHRSTEDLGGSCRCRFECHRMSQEEGFKRLA